MRARRTSLHFDPGFPHHLMPLADFGADEAGELVGAPATRLGGKIGQLRLQLATVEQALLMH